MFKKTTRDAQIDLFGGLPSILGGKAKKQYDDARRWHNQFYTQIVDRLDESLFSMLFSEGMGAPNASISVMLGMMILKEGMGWSDLQLYEQCRFNLLVRKALGLININDEIPVESTYYLLRKKIHQFDRENSTDLLAQAFAGVTSEQIKEFNVNGQSIRMDSKLIGSNIALYTRYEIVLQTLQLFFKNLDKKALLRLPKSIRPLLSELLEEDPEVTVYRQSREEIRSRMQSLGDVYYRLSLIFKNDKSDHALLLKRVFEEQYKVLEGHKIELRPKEEIRSDSVQSPHDPDCTYRNKGDQKVKGYSANVTETCSDESLNLITDINVQTSNTSDVNFVQPSIRATEEVTQQPVEKVYADGAYQSPDNDAFCENIDMVFTGISGAESRYIPEWINDELMVTDSETGEIHKAKMVKKTKASTQDRWYIKTKDGTYYFDKKVIRTAELRRKMRGRSLEELHKRNNVEATVFQLSYPLRNNKTKYRGLIKTRMWAVCRCLWINLVRIVNFTQQTCQRTFQTAEKAVFVDLLLPLRANFMRFTRYQAENYWRILSFNSFLLVFSFISV
ncbi:MAG: transposase [Chloroflexi bacterium]|nr:transposase [Chloroflexota bacterium]